MLKLKDASNSGTCIIMFGRGLIEVCRIYPSARKPELKGTRDKLAFLFPAIVENFEFEAVLNR